MSADSAVKSRRDRARRPRQGRLGKITVETGVDGQTQRTSFENATLSGPFGTYDVSIAVFPAVPEEVSRKGERAVAGYLTKTLEKILCAGWDIEIQIGPSECAEGAMEKKR